MLSEQSLREMVKVKVQVALEYTVTELETIGSESYDLNIKSCTRFGVDMGVSRPMSSSITRR